MKVAIIGGGIGGLCCAIGLRQAGLAVTVYEQAEAWGEVGAGLTLWPNAIRALRPLGVADAVIDGGSKLQWSEIRRASGRSLAQSHPGEFEQRFGEPAVAIHRAVLHRILLSVLPPDAVRLAARYQAFEQDVAGVTAHFGNGPMDTMDGPNHTTERADLLIGADGIHSRLRRQVIQDVRLRYAGYTAWRAVVPVSDKVTLGRTSETWGRGARFGIVPIDKQRIYWFASANAKPGTANPDDLSGETPDQANTAEERKALLQQRFAGWHDPIASLIHSTPANSILQNDIYDFQPLPHWSRGRVVLLGDAVHATTPNLGQGACMAIESSVVLARCLAEENDLTRALTLYETIRKPRTSRITQQSWQIGRIGQLENPLACRLRDLAVSMTPESVIKSRLAWAVGYRV